MKYYVVDVFTDHLFGGNPAGVCLLDRWPEEELLQNIAFMPKPLSFLLKSNSLLMPITSRQSSLEARESRQVHLRNQKTVNSSSFLCPKT